MSIVELKSNLEAALKSGDMEAITKASQDVVEFQRAQAKVEAEKAKAEMEKMSGARLELATSLTKSIKASKLGKANFSISVADLELAVELVKLLPDVVSKVKAVKGSVVSFKLPDEQSDVARVALAVITTKRASGGGTVARGKSKDEYGMSLGEIFDKFATPEDKAKLAAATSNSSQWQVKVSVKKRGIATGQLAPVK